MIPPYCGQSGLKSLIREAFNVYQEEVVGQGKAYRRYVADFLNSRRFHDAADAYSRNSHNKNLGIIEELLLYRNDLVQHYFTLSVLSSAAVDAILASLDKLSVSEKMKEREEDMAIDMPTSFLPYYSFESSMDSTVLTLLVDCANEIHLFKERVSLTDLTSLFSCRPVRKLTARHNGLFAVFMEGLSSRGFITSNWQRIFSAYILVYSSSGKTPLDQKRLSAALYQFNLKKTPSVMRKLLLFLDQLKDVQQSKRNIPKE